MPAPWSVVNLHMLGSDADHTYVLPAMNAEPLIRQLDWTQLVLADDDSPVKAFVCPDFGQPGWAPFCFLNGNPVFQAFDGFQAFIQSAVVSLHDFLQQVKLRVFLRNCQLSLSCLHLIHCFIGSDTRIRACIWSQHHSIHSVRAGRPLPHQLQAAGVCRDDQVPKPQDPGDQGEVCWQQRPAEPDDCVAVPGGQRK